MPPEAKLRMRNVGKYANHVHVYIHKCICVMFTNIMIGILPHHLVPIHSTRAGWDSLIHEQATRDTTMTIEYQCMYPLHSSVHVQICIHNVC